MKIKNLKIGKKLKLAFGTVIILFMITVLSAFIGIQSVSSSFNNFYKEPYAITQYTANMKYSFQSAEKFMLMAITSRDSKAIQEYMDSCQKQLDTIGTNMELFKELYSDDNNLLVEYQNLMDSSVSIKEQIFKALEKNQNDSALIKYQLNYAPILKNARAKLDEIGAIVSQNADDFYQQGASAQKASFFVFAALTIASLAVVIGFCAYIIKSITKPLKEIETAANKMAVGDMNAVINYVSKDELGTLADSMRKMMEIWRAYIYNISNVLGNIANGKMDILIDMEYKGDFIPIKNAMEKILVSLNDMLSQITLSSEQVASGSEQVSGGAQALSQGATEQASSIEELAATINEISGKIKENSANAQKANNVVNETNEKLIYGNQRMENLITAMGQITQTSNEIGKIIKTIDDIAFQTNILALNAAVEAARAGAAGKGFAVVADEVRNLAGKSAEAAKNTTALIESAIHAITNGSQMADETSAAMQAVVEHAKFVAQYVDQIAQASNEQADAIMQTTQGVDQISGVVQTNSATAEESAAASEELTGQAEMLKQLVSRFTLRKNNPSNLTSDFLDEVDEDTTGEEDEEKELVHNKYE